MEIIAHLVRHALVHGGRELAKFIDEQQVIRYTLKNNTAEVLYIIAYNPLIDSVYAGEFISPRGSCSIKVSGKEYEAYEAGRISFIPRCQNADTSLRSKLIPLYPAWWVGQTVSGTSFGGNARASKNIPLIDPVYLDEIGQKIYKKKGWNWAEIGDTPVCVIRKATSSHPEVEIYLERIDEETPNLLRQELRRNPYKIVNRSAFPIENLKPSFITSFTLAFG